MEECQLFHLRIQRKGDEMSPGEELVEEAQSFHD